MTALHRLRRALCALALPLSLAGCGGGAALPVPPLVPEPAGPGRLVEVQARPFVPAADIAAAIAASPRLPSLVPRYDVATYRIDYRTVDADGRELTASGLVAVPLKGAGRPSPLLSYHHGTIFYDDEAPTNAVGAEAPPVVLASLGYLVAAPDYVGYGASKGAGHPYLLSAPSAAAVLDLLAAVRTWQLRNGVAGNGQLFLAGYSEGGYVTLAAQRAIEAGASPWRDELVGSVPGGGPYHVAATLDALLQRVKDENRFLGAFIDPGLLRHLPGAIRVEVRRALVRKLVPDDSGVSFDTRFVDAFFEDDRSKIERQSNVHDWRAERGVRLFHGRDDRTVPYIAGRDAYDAMRARGSADVTMADCEAVPADHLECVAPYFDFIVRTLAPHARNL